MFPGNISPKRSLDRSAERDLDEEAKQVYQLSTVNEYGAFIPPTPVDKGHKYHVDHVEDYFTTIINAPPEKVRTFLSTESTISPGMFSTLPSSKIKRHSMPSFSSTSMSSPPKKSATLSTQKARGSSMNVDTKNRNSRGESSPPAEHNNTDCFIDVDITAPSSITTAVCTTENSQTATSLISPLAAPAMDDVARLPISPRNTPELRPEQYSRPPRQQQHQQQESSGRPLHRISEAKRKSRAQISFLTGAPTEEEEIRRANALSDPFLSLLSSSLPDLVTDFEGDQSDESSSSSPLTSPSSSPRYSASPVSFEKEQIRRLNAQKLRAQNDFGGALRVSH
ncbi:hypothetical protein BGZ99_005727 [Dissophora globulifera]|uniref:Uncharacterized protein n=1 Tax=Dissophora globulifera TaxID=979702 RepID=A0A9P6USY6_9FUNG|nr:hypothetical protein BGZ99_005727 [Dissophora globulifera]